jgi:hypothetical protein
VFSYLAVQKAPRSFASGTRESLLFQPRPDLVIGLLKDDPRPTIEMYKLRRPIDDDVKKLFGIAPA